MEEKILVDVKEIAKIIKKTHLKTTLVNLLFNYLKKEDEIDYWKTHNPKHDVYFLGANKLNKEQFFKNCGI